MKSRKLEEIQQEEWDVPLSEETESLEEKAAEEERTGRRDGSRGRGSPGRRRNEEIPEEIPETLEEERMLQSRICS